MGEVTKELPKPMLTVLGKTLIEHRLDMLPESVDEIIFVVNYLSECIREKFGDSYNGRRILYVEQQGLNGTADALWQTRHLLHDDFLVMYADDIYTREDIAAVVATPWSVLGLYSDDVGSAAKLEFGEGGKVTRIVEVNEHDGGAGVLNAAVFNLDMRLFDHEMTPAGNGKTEFGLPQTVVDTGIPLTYVEGHQWLQITEPEDIAKAEAILSAK
jgi:NDP-sugar pyrophosphorylase family protein